jgi:isopropylmalate/homocitrate/citramalate synthase
MRSLALVALVAALVLTVGAPAYAFKCPSLIRQANEQMAKMDASSDKVKQAKALVGEADALHKAGKHADSVKKAEEALALLQ